MFTDLVGFTKLGQEDEARALRLRKDFQSIVRPIFAARSGREVKSMGDGFLVEFGSALDSVQCAIEIQVALARRNLSAEEFDRIQLRIGVHVGDVVHEGDDLVGDAVNVASRIEPLAEPGGICVSGPVFDQVRNKLPDPMVKLPYTELKNLRHPVDVYKVSLPWDRIGAPIAPGIGSRSRIAILPLSNLSPDPNDEFFSDGLTDEMIAELSRVPGLRVIARTSVMRFKGTTKGILEIGNELKVGSVLEGSVRRFGDRIRVTAQLIDARSEEHLWSEKYDRDFGDIFAIQSEIAAKVAEALHLAIPPEIGNVQEPTTDLEAYKSYLMGRYLWQRRSPESVRAALACFEEALKRDANYAKAYCGVADCYCILEDWGQVRASEAGPKALAAARRALELDNMLSEAHASLGLVLQRSMDWNGADHEFQLAIELNPMNAMAHHWRYMGLFDRAKIDDAIRELHRAADADPLAPTVIMHEGHWAWIQGQDERAMALWDRAIQLGGWNDTATVWKIAVLSRAGRLDEARALLPRGESMNSHFFGRTYPIILHSLLGMNKEATQEAVELMRSPEEPPEPAARLAWMYGVLGDADKFFEWAFRSVDEGGPGPFLILASPLFATLRKDPRYREYRRRLKLEQ